MPRKLLIAALVLPLIVLALGIVRAERHLADGKRWMFEVNGYDPRDLLRGHYINYRLVLEQSPADERCDDDHGERCCLCLTSQPAGMPTKAQRTTCESAETRCDGVLKTRYLSELQRYYIPEERAAELTARFQDAAREHRAQLVVAIDAQGKPQIDTLTIDGMALERTRE